MSHLMLRELESNAPSLSEGQNDKKPGFEKFGRIPYWILEQMYELDYCQDVSAMVRERQEKASKQGARKATEQRNAYRRQHPRFGKAV